MNSAPPCPACAIVRGERRPPGGVVFETSDYVVHGLDGPSPLRGWVVLTSRVHTRGWYTLAESALVPLGPLAQRIMRLQRSVLGAEHVYALALGDLLEHFHLHLVPRYADTAPRLRGRGAFDALPEDGRPLDEVEAALRSLGDALQRT